MNSFSAFLSLLATATLAAGQAERTLAARFSATLSSPRSNPLAPRRLAPGAAVCVNPPLNLTGLEIEVRTAARQLAQRMQEAGFRSGASQPCDATVFTEIVASGGVVRKNVELQFRIVLADEQIPRLCSSARGRPAPAWRDALLAAFAEEARQIRGAQAKGMPIYRGAVE